MSDDERVTELRALAHPVRLQILSLLTGAELSAAEVARELGLTHANASYHLRTLLAAGELTVTGEERIRGGIAKRYRHEWRRSPARHDDQAPQGRDRVRARRRRRAGAQVRRSRHRPRQPAAPRSPTRSSGSSRTPTSGPATLVEQASHLLHDAARPPRTEGTIRVNLTAAAFRMADH